MARTDNFTGKVMNCVICAKPIPADRRWDAVTCSKECSTARQNFFRSHQDLKECRYCQRPSTPEERMRYQAWRRWEKAGLSDEASAASLLRENARLKRKLAELTPHAEEITQC
jgi:hypothetical protein